MIISKLLKNNFYHLPSLFKAQVRVSAASTQRSTVFLPVSRTTRVVLPAALKETPENKLVQNLFALQNEQLKHYASIVREKNGEIRRLNEELKMLAETRHISQGPTGGDFDGILVGFSLGFGAFYLLNRTTQKGNQK